MAFCTNCGALLNDGVAFCTGCGKPVASAPVTRAPRKSKKVLILGVAAAVLLVGVVLGILALTGVFGSKLPVGTWTISYATNINTSPGSVTLVIDKSGSGYYKWTRDYGGIIYTFFDRLTCTESVLILDDKVLSYTRDKDTLTVMFEDGAMCVYTRVGDAEKRSMPKPGMYRLVSAVWGGQNETENHVGSYVQINDNNMGVFFDDNASISIQVDTYLISMREDSVYYTYDGTNLTLIAGSMTMTFVRMG